MRSTACDTTRSGRLLSERLHDAHAGEPLLQRRHRVGDAVTEREERRPRALAVTQDDHTSTGTDTSITSESSGDSHTRITIETTNSRTEPTTSTSTRLVNVVSVWTSAVRRDTSTPERVCSKNGIDSAWSFSYAATRRSPRNRSPARALQSTITRSSTGRATTRHDERARRSVDRVHVVRARSRGRSRASRAEGAAREIDRRADHRQRRPARSAAAAAAASGRWRAHAAPPRLREREQPR